MQVLFVLLSLFGNTELFNKHGKKIGEDKNRNDGKVSIITDRKAIKRIAYNFKNGGLASKSDINDGIRTTKTVLTEALHILKRTESNGGLREECSVVTAKGRVVRGKTGDLPDINNGIQVAETMLPRLLKNEKRKRATSIHSHPLVVRIKNETYYPHIVTNPSFNPDLWTFAYYETNIIVGNLQKERVILTSTGIVKISSSKGIAIYKKGKGDKAVLILKEKAVQRIIKLRTLVLN